MLSPQFVLPLAPKLVVDLFAGGGGASTGIEQAIGRHVDIAVNHDADAIGMHEINHPQTRHFQADVWDVDPVLVTGGMPVGLLHASPDCTDHSQAKGGQPRSQAIRSLAWVVHRWAGKAKPDVITLENVEQMLRWSNLVAKRDKATGRVVTLDILTDADGKKTYRVAEPGERVPRRRQFLVPDEKRLGTQWKRFVQGLRDMGYAVQWRVICNADLGAHSTRTRLYMIARRDGLPIVWPEKTHAKKPTGTLKRHMPAADCIDWSIEGKSIFDRKKPLADATLRRIAYGLQKYVLDSANPFIVNMATEKGGCRALVTPTLVQMGYGEREGQAPRALDIDGALGTVTAGGNKFGLTTAFMVQANGGFNSTPARDLQDAMSTVTTTGSQQQLITALLEKNNGQNLGSDHRRTLQGATGRHDLATETEAQLGEVCASGTTSRRASQEERLSGHQDGISRSAALGVRASSGLDHSERADPAGHADQSHRREQNEQLARESGASDSIGEYEARLPNGVESSPSIHPGANSCATHPPSERVAQSGNELLENCEDPGHLPDDSIQSRALRVAGFLLRYHGSGGQWTDLRDPMTTVTTHDRLALVTVWLKGEPWVIVDITLRMLVPRELYRAQDFPDNYVIDKTAAGKPLTKTAQVRMAGNSVSPLPMCLIVGCNYSETQSIPMRRTA